jgi:hypothetical protein
MNRLRGRFFGWCSLLFSHHSRFKTERENAQHAKRFPHCFLTFSCSITKWRSEPGTSSVAFLLLNNAARKSYIAFPSQKYPFAARTLLRLLTTTIPRHYSCAVTSLKTDRRFLGTGFS